MTKIFAVFGGLVLAAFAWSSYAGWNFTTYETIRDVPRSVRNNPGSYRSVYQRVPHK
jgi:hypothetical protein